jgi:hypothetical protein
MLQLFAHLSIGVFGQADPAGFGDAFQTRGDIDAVAHQVAVGFLDHVAEVNADAEFDPPLLRQAGVSLGHAVLNFDGAAHGLDHAPEFDQSAVAGALDDTPAMRGDGRIDQVATQRPQPRERPLLVGAGQPAVAGDVGRQDRRKLPGLGHRVAPVFDKSITNVTQARLCGSTARDRAGSRTSMARPRTALAARRSAILHPGMPGCTTLPATCMTKHARGCYIVHQGASAA